MTSSHDALYRAICAQPDEDTPRLVFADLIEEDGDASYAAFIRKQIALAKVPEWDPLWVRAWNEDRNALTGRGFSRFVPQVPDALSWPSLTSFRRGFLWHVESTVGSFLEHADRLFAAVPLRALTIRSERGEWRDPIDLTALFASPHLARLEQLSFTLTRFTPETVRQMRACPHLTNLTGLRFNFASFDDGALRELFRPSLVERLESLSFENGSIRWGDLATGIADAGGPHRLRRFVTSGKSEDGEGRAKVFAAPLLRGLKELDLGGYRLGETNVRALCGSPIVDTLESLTLNGSAPGVPSIKALSECAALGGLKRLRLWANSIGPVGAKALAGSPHLSGLRVLELDNNPLGDKGAATLAGAPFIMNLIELGLMHCRIGDRGAESLVNALSADEIIQLTLFSYKVKLSDAMKTKLRNKFGGRLFA